MINGTCPHGILAGTQCDQCKWESTHTASQIAMRTIAITPPPPFVYCHTCMSDPAPDATCVKHNDSCQYPEIRIASRDAAALVVGHALTRPPQVNVAPVRALLTPNTIAVLKQALNMYEEEARDDLALAEEQDEGDDDLTEEAGLVVAIEIARKELERLQE